MNYNLNAIFFCKFNPGYFFKITQYIKTGKDIKIVKFKDLQTKKIHSQSIDVFEKWDTKIK